MTILGQSQGQCHILSRYRRKCKTPLRCRRRASADDQEAPQGSLAHLDVRPSLNCRPWHMDAVGGRPPSASPQGGLSRETKEETKWVQSRAHRGWPAAPNKSRHQSAKFWRHNQIHTSARCSTMPRNRNLAAMTVAPVRICPLRRQCKNTARAPEVISCIKPDYYFPSALSSPLSGRAMARRLLQDMIRQPHRNSLPDHFRPWTWRCLTASLLLAFRLMGALWPM